ncbi:hypothetical protein BGZ61DRAFT_16631 [Ilyonectria robusta]|uniref:uncharacterized protein n=1 Tax=Ilyonectria robusta TaxID=1079257 RepID=UPI001E8E591D|nr:uncharacterized protein BGZ61DRAFT_16631 [Ilyonectria robusta]KAH8737483.1 hypothetical protein BGZ61DRAFT_16631 [Ilyonectria robusta]
MPGQPPPVQNALHPTTSPVRPRPKQCEIGLYGSSPTVPPGRDRGGRGRRRPVNVVATCCGRLLGDGDTNIKPVLGQTAMSYSSPHGVSHRDLHLASPSLVGRSGSHESTDVRGKQIQLIILAHQRHRPRDTETAGHLWTSFESPSQDLA